MFINGIIKSEELFKFFGDNEGGNREDDSNFDEAWSPITEKSTQKCLDMSNYIFIMQSVVFLIRYLILQMKVAPSANQNCTFSDHLQVIVWCIVQVNFLECPTSMIIDSARYETVKDLVKNADECGEKSNVIYLINVEFWFMDRKEALNSSELAVSEPTQ